MNKTTNKSVDDNLIAGIQPVAAALRHNPGSIERLSVTQGSHNQRVHDLVLLAGDAGIEVRQERREWLDQMSGFARHQDVIAHLRAHSQRAESELLPLLAAQSQPPLVLVLDGVQDPHNLGACLRTAEAAGVHAVVIPKDRSASVNATVRKTSAGASELVPVFQVTNLARTLRQLKEAGIWLVGTSDQAPRALYEQDLGGPLALVMGSEGDGLRRLTAESCDHLVHIPMHGAIESLNVSVATGVCLYEIQRQRRAG